MRRNKYIWVLVLLLCSMGLKAAPLTLDSCLRLAQENNPAIRRAELEVERAEQVRMQALTKFFPQVQATAVGFHALEPMVEVSLDDIGQASVRELLTLLYGQFGEALGLGNTVSLFQHGVSAGVTAVQPVFMGGKIIAGNQLAKVGVEAAQLQEQMTRRDLLEEVEESYWLVVGLQDKRRTLEHVTLLMDTVEHIVAVAVQSGLALETDLMQVEMKRSELERQRILLESGLGLARRALAHSIGVDAIGEVESADVLREQPSVSASAERVEQQLLALKTRATELERTMTIADALPRVVVGASYGYGRTDVNILRDGMGGWNGALFAMVSVPLTGWWETGHRIKEKSIVVEQARLEQQDLMVKLGLRSEQARDEMLVAAMLVEQAERAVNLAAKRAHLSEVGYRAGTVSVTELLTAEVDLMQAENELTDARIAYRVRLRRYQDIGEKE